MNLIIHHWDTDGICSASLILEVVDNTENITLLPGIFKFDERVWNAVNRAEKVYVVDVNLPKEVERIEKPVVFLDHHIQNKIEKKNVIHVNPIFEGKQAPSASYVVSSFFSHWDWRSALGAVGDVGRRAFRFDWVLKILKKYELSEKEALRLAELINSPSLLFDRRGVEEAVEKVANNDPKYLLEDDEWNKNVERIEQEITRILKNVRENGKFSLAKFSSDYNIASIIARKLVWDSNSEVAVVVNENYHGFSQLYVRVKEDRAKLYKIEELIKKLKSKNLNAGGKKDVLGVICEREKLGEVVKVIEDHFGESLW